MNQSTSYVEGILKKHSLTPILIGDGSTVVGQYPSSTTEVTMGSKSTFINRWTEIYNAFNAWLVS